MREWSLTWTLSLFCCHYFLQLPLAQLVTAFDVSSLTNYQDLTSALKMLGLNPLEQEVLDLTNEIARNGFIYFPQFCKIIHRKYREENELLFRQNLFKVKV